MSLVRWPPGVTGPPPPAGPPLPPPPPRERRATAANLAAARQVLGAHVGLRPFKDYVQRVYGRVDDASLREFLRGEDALQVFAPPPRSEGKVATTGKKDD